MLFEEVEYIGSGFPRETLEKAISQKEEIIPELLEILEYTCQNAEKLAEENKYIAHIYALYLLAEFREHSAYPLIYRLLNKPSIVLDVLLDDIVTEGASAILASVCGGDTELICKLIENQEVNEYIRGSAIESLVTLVVHGIKERDEIVSYLKSLYRDKLERTYSHVWDSLAAHSCDLYPDELIEDIKLAYEEDLIDSYYIPLEDIENQLKKDKKTVLEELTNNPRYQLVNDTILELENWACFDENYDTENEKEDWRAIAKINSEQEIQKTPIKQEPYRKEIKVGRNDPCLCGSGKKYKKCCGRDI